ncbi:MAG TPA: hypothetical protein VN752_09340 [Solirubrobacterales bacterium]|nr:hypothetical protein [Solirubrobacterales bacterium]
MSELAGRKSPQLLSPFWPLDDQHGVGHIRLEAEPPTNRDETMPLLLKLAAQSDAMRSLQTSNGDPVSERGASALRGEMAEGLRELADLVDEESAALIRMRAKALAGGAGHKETTLKIAAHGSSPALEIVCGPLCTWRPKTREPLHSFIAAARDESAQAKLDSLDEALEDALDELRSDLDTPSLKLDFALPFNVTDLIASAGEAAGHPKHFAYFLPEDEGVDDLPLREQRTLYLHNVHLARYRLITVPLAEALLDGPRRAGEVDIEATLMPWIRGHDHGHNLIVETTDYGWMETLGVEPFMMLQEAIANVYGFLLTISEPWLTIAGTDRREMCATHMAEMLHYMRRGPWHYGDCGSAYVELSFLVENGFVEIDAEGTVSWSEEEVCRGMTALASALTESTVGAADKRGSVALIERYGWPRETAAKRTLTKLRGELSRVPTSLAFYSADSEAPDAIPGDSAPIAA